MSISICDISAVLKVSSLALYQRWRLALTWRQNVRASIVCMAISVALQSVVAFAPMCASIIDMRRMPIIGGPR
jgi:hypothetical protein